MNDRMPRTKDKVPNKDKTKQRGRKRIEPVDLKTALKAFALAEDLGLDTPILASALGVEEVYLERVRAELRRAAKHPEKHAPSRKLITQRTIRGVEGICNLIAMRREQHQSDWIRRGGERYIEHVRQEIRALGETAERLRIGAMGKSPTDAKQTVRHSVASIPPLLEQHRSGVRREIINAARRGGDFIQFDYYYPSGNAISSLLEAFGRPQGQKSDGTSEPDSGARKKASSKPGLEARLSHRKDEFDKLFGWIRPVAESVETVMRALANDAAQMDIETRGSTLAGGMKSDNWPHVQAVADRIDFYTLRGFPVSLSEKIVFISHPGVQVIRKEVLLLPDPDKPQHPIYDPKHDWISVNYPITEAALKALLRLGREHQRPHDWKEIVRHWGISPRKRT